MGELSKIEWTDHTFNPWIGCAKVSEGCANCYAEDLMDRRMGFAKWGPNGTRRRTSAAWKLPRRWNNRACREHRMAKVFCASLADVFEDRPELVPWRDELLSLIHTTPNLYWQLLTKRPENVLRMVDDLRYPLDGLLWDQFRERVWMGTSAENQEMLDKRAPELLKIPARVRWLSLEPLLGPVDLTRALVRSDGPQSHEWRNLLTGEIYSESPAHGHRVFGTAERIDWVVVGGESGPNWRSCSVDWIEDIHDQCKAAGVPVFIKQAAGPKPGMQGRIPDDLWSVKEFPLAA